MVLFMNQKKPELAKAMKVNEDNEIVPRFPFTSEVQVQRSVSIVRYLRDCEREGKRPCKKEWAEIVWNENDEGPGAA